MANTYHPEKPVAGTEINVKSLTLTSYEIGDLLYLDSGVAKPASALADQGTEALNQAAFAPAFLGLCRTQKLVTDAGVDEIGVCLDLIVEMDCISTTYEVGDKFTIDEASGGTALEDQVLQKTTDETLAIATAITRAGSATTRVWVRLTSRVIRNDVAPDVTAQLSSATVPVIVFNGATGINEIRIPTNLADALSIESSAGDIATIDTTTGTVVFNFGAAVRVNVAGDAQIGSATTDLVAFHGSTPTDQCAAYTQTYATADRTHSAPTAATLTAADGAGTNDNTIGAITADASVIAAVQEIVDEINKLIADVADAKQMINSIVDDLQEKGLVG